MGKNRTVKLVFLLAALIMINGCTVVCYGLGRTFDTYNPEIVTISHQKIITLRKETAVDMVLVNGKKSQEYSSDSKRYCLENTRQNMIGQK